MYNTPLIIYVYRKDFDPITLPLHTEKWLNGISTKIYYAEKAIKLIDFLSWNKKNTHTQIAGDYSPIIYFFLFKMKKTV